MGGSGRVMVVVDMPEEATGAKEWSFAGSVKLPAICNMLTEQQAREDLTCVIYVIFERPTSRFGSCSSSGNRQVGAHTTPMCAHNSSTMCI